MRFFKHNSAEISDFLGLFSKTEHIFEKYSKNFESLFGFHTKTRKKRAFVHHNESSEIS